MKKLFLLTGVLLSGCLFFVPSLFAGDLFNPGTYERFEQLGKELSTHMQQLDRQLADMQSRRTEKVRSVFFNSAGRFAGRTGELSRMLEQMEQELLANGADDIFVERHRAQAAALNKRFATMAESIRQGDIDDIIERDLLSGRNKRRQAIERSRAFSRDAQQRKTSGEIVKPKGRELTKAEIDDLNQTRHAFGLLSEGGTFKMVKFDSNDSPSAEQPSQPLLSSVASWDLDLPRNARPIQVAGLSSVQGLLSQATIAAIAPPVAADLLEDDLGDVVFTESIKALADSLGKNPIRIYEWVKNTIDFQPYRGSLKGAAQTLAEGCGNDVDIASLLIALLRYSGYPARYAEVRAIVDINRAMQWLGMKSPEMVGYYLSTGDTGNVEDLYRGSTIAQSKFRHTCVEVYLPYADYRGTNESERHKLWVPLAPAFKQQRSTAGAIHDPDLGFDAEQFIQSLDQFSSIADSGLVNIDNAAFQEFMTTSTADYQSKLQVFLDEHPDMTLRDFYGYDEVQSESFPILPITLPFETDSSQYRTYSAVSLEEHHQVSVRLSYWGVDLDIELETLEIDYHAPTSLVAGQRLVMSYVPSTSEDNKTLAEYTGTFFDTPCYLIYMRPQLRLNGRLVAENTGKDAEISMGLEETLRVSIVRPGEDLKEPSRTSDYVTTVGDHTAIVLGLGRGSSENITAAIARFGEALDERTSEMDRLLGEQLNITGSSYFYQLDTHADLIARQLGVRWYRNPSDIRVARHLKVSYLFDIWPVRITETNIRVDVSERIQAVPQNPDWNLRDAFLRSESMQGSVFEHLVLQQLFRQESVSAVKLVAEAVSKGVPLYQFTQDMESFDLSPLQLETEDLEIVSCELTEYGQNVLVPAARIDVGTFTGVGIISTTPPGNPLGPYRMGYFISLKGADPYVIDGGQIVEEIDKWNRDFVDPDYRDWIQVAGLLSDATTAIITNSESIRAGNVPVNTLIRGIAQNVMELQLARIRAMGVGNISFNLACAMGQIGSIYQAQDSLNEFMNDTWVLYIDYENEKYNWENYYFPSIDNGERTVKYALINLYGFGVSGRTPAISSTHPDFELVGVPVPTAGTLGEGYFTFRMNNADSLKPGDTIPITLSITSPEGREVRTTATFKIGVVDLDIDSNNDNGFEEPDCSRTEDVIEEKDGSTGTPGKVMGVNDWDVDGDDVPNFADGFSTEKFENAGENAGGQFVPVIVEFAPSLDPDRTYVTFTYSESDPNGVKRTDGRLEDTYIYTAAEGHMRLWTKNGEESRNPAEVDKGGDFVRSGIKYKASDLGFDQQLTLYVEAVNPGSALADQSIKVSCIAYNENDEVLASGEDTVKVTIVKINMGVDGNRDTEIKFDDPEDKKYEFWVNNDNDGYDYLGISNEEIDKDGTSEDNDDDKISLLRDLEDFSRLHIEVPKLLADVSGISYGLNFERLNEEQEVPKINLFLAISKSGSLDYLKESENGKLQIKEEKLLQVSTEESLLPDNTITAGERYYAIFEGVDKGEGNLTLTVKLNGHDAFKQTVKLTLRDIEAFYRRWVVTADEDDVVDIDASIEFVDESKYKYQPETNDLVLFVHGWRLEEYEKRRWAETVFKRLWWQGYKGHVASLEWPTLGILSYDRSDFRAYQTGHYLKRIFEWLQADSPHKGRVRILAHSQGNQILGEALRLLPQGIWVHTYIATQAAVSGHTYAADLPDIPGDDDRPGNTAPFPDDSGPETPEVLRYFSCGKDSVSDCEPYYETNISKVGEAHRYFNPMDFALRWWDTDNYMKPNDLTGGYGYRGSTTSYTPYPPILDSFYQLVRDGLDEWGNPAYVERDLNIETPLERYEIFSYCAEARSRALGILVSNPPGFQGFSLMANIGYDKNLYSHSRQFKSNIIDEWIYWKTFMGDCKLNKLD